MLKRIAGFTLVARAIDTVIQAYEASFEYRRCATGFVSAALADQWLAPRCAGRRHALLVPRGVDGIAVRVIEAPAAAALGTSPPPAFGSLGWSAAELIVKDVDALALELQGSAFRCLRPPADLSFSDQIRAMQVVGPGGDVLYLTQVKSQIAGLDLPTTPYRVGPPFIMVLGAGSIADTRRWFHEVLQLPAAPVQAVRMSALSSAWGLPLDQRHELCAMPMGGQCYLEIDAMPPAAPARSVMAGELSLGIAMVSFEVAELPAQLPYLRQPARFQEAPYFDRRAGVLRGPDGELIELIEVGDGP